MEKLITMNQVVETYCLGKDQNITYNYLEALHNWAHYNEIAFLIWKHGDKWYIGFDRSLTKLMKHDLYLKEGISLWFPIYKGEA